MTSRIITTFENTTENQTLFETFKPKIEQYRAKLSAGILDEYKLPDELIPTESGIDVTSIPEKIMSEKEIAITELKAVDLASKIATGEFTAVEVFNAYAKRATAAHQLTNCAMELFMDEGLQRAKELDAFFEKEGKTVGPLHGVPVSIKEHYDYKGKVTHGGYVGLLDNISTETNQCLQILYDAGAVYYIRTSEPQCLMHLCSNNNITGLTKNPRNTNLTTGGSSSGEGAITAMKGSALGVGSDIGGSIRCPAAFCGVWGMRPTQKRIPLLPLVPAGEKVQDAVNCSLGPFARCAEDLELFMKVELFSEPWKNDPTLVRIPWKEVSAPVAKEIKVAIIYDDGVVKPTPPILRGLKTAAEKLTAAGVKVVEWDAKDVAECIAACGDAYNADGNYGQKSLLGLSGEPLCKLSKTALSFGCGGKGMSATEFESVFYTRNKYQGIVAKQMESLDVDFILSPAYVSVAAEPEKVQYWGYTNLWNILDYPNVIFPTGLVCDATLDAPDANYKPRSDIEKYEYGLYDDANKFVGAPISLQLTARRFYDEELVKASKLVAEIIN